MDDKKRRKILENLKYEEVIKYKTEHGCTYLIVEKSKDGKVSGQMASPIGVNAISIEELLKKDNLEIANWTRL